MSAGPGGEQVHLSISNDADIVRARQEGRSLAARAGCVSTDMTEVATAISELARNIVSYALGGELFMELVEDGGRPGLRIVATDRGPGIEDVELAMEDGFSSDEGLGLGLPGARRLMDDFRIASKPGVGTTVVAYKWGRVGG